MLVALFSTLFPICTLDKVVLSVLPMYYLISQARTHIGMVLAMGVLMSPHMHDVPAV
jgi:hypothetical protein